ncbi:polysaccharide deacetylase family protein [Arthrobacter sp. GMC3]|uniref:polysaccharide deacetylase family protein n=1 Tax=Arthrobacter sp. GMC3 TaxID=2058894 RepID=UPI000CE47F78|nr:polysaccharide deacetylase family protein [Arthrobacter sp. GMC3]
MTHASPSALVFLRRTGALAAVVVLAMVTACAPITPPAPAPSEQSTAPPTPGAWMAPLPNERDLSTVAGAYPMNLQAPKASGSWVYMDGATSFNAAIDKQLLAELDKYTGGPYQPAVRPAQTSTPSATELIVRGSLAHAGGTFLIGRLRTAPPSGRGPVATAEETVVYDSGTGTTVSSAELIAPAHHDQLSALAKASPRISDLTPVVFTDLAFDDAGNLTLTVPNVAPPLADTEFRTVTVPAATVRPWLSGLGRSVQDAAALPWQPPTPEPKVLRHINCDIVACAALTYDDGPSQATTPRLLTMLEQAGVGATFFTVGGAVNYSPKLVTAEHDAGFSVGNHTWNHPDLRKLSPGAVVDQIQRTNTAIKAATGEESTLMRPPYGGVNQMVRTNVGMPIILWSVDSQDWLSRDPAKYIPAIMNQVFPGAVILEHDIHATTVDHQPEVIADLQRAGYNLVTVPQLFSGIALQPGQVFSCRGHGKDCTPSPGR